jgi:hypothetical protein
LGEEDGVGELDPARFEGDPLQEQNKQENNTAMNATAAISLRFILPPGRIADFKSGEMPDLLPFPAKLA